MRQLFFVFLFHLTLCLNCQASDTLWVKKYKSFGIQSNTFLIDHPLFFNRGTSMFYSHDFLVKKKNHLAISPQVGFLKILEIEQKFIFTAALQYKYIGKKRFEASAFIGANYILSKLDYDLLEYEGNSLVNKGNAQYHFGPSAGITFGYKVWKRKHYSISPFVGLSVIQFGQNYRPSLFKNYKQSLNIGLNINLHKNS
jgi:hypothetical protein